MMLTARQRPERYLVFDAGCSVCTNLAKTVENPKAPANPAVSVPVAGRSYGQEARR